MSRFFFDARTARATWTILVILATLWLAYALRGVLLLVALSLFFAYLLLPLVRLVERRLTQRRAFGFGLAWCVEAPADPHSGPVARASRRSVVHASTKYLVIASGGPMPSCIATTAVSNCERARGQ